MKINTHHLVCLFLILNCTADAASSTGNFLLQNYKQALDTRANLLRELHIFEKSTKFIATDFLRWHKEETAFLSTLQRKEPDVLILKVSYVEAMECLFELQ
jgi:hypothetical protein